jgi:two-component system, NtrC family, response regulator AtoC
LPAALLESELFGHERGSFTGATERRVGRFEAADGGTVFLDEIGEIGPEIQVKLLRFIETKSFERIGSTKTMTVDVRLVAATNRNLEQMVKEGKFREDLFFRLNVVRITTPALRERADDIPVLLDHFIRQFAKENAYQPVTIEPGAMRHLQIYPWPGNIRELRNFAENIVVLRRGGSLSEFELEPKFRGEGDTLPPLHAMPSVNPLSVEENGKRLLREALIKARGNRTQAAELLGISRRTLHRKIAQWPELDVVDR